jgi:hypothetical protein
MNKLCVLCPSRYRPELLERALKSYEHCAVQSDIVFRFQNNDEYLLHNIDLVKKKYGYIIGDEVGFSKKINELVYAFNEKKYDAYMILNDDQIIHTKGFDKILLDKLNELEKHRLWILHWKDGYKNEKLPQSFCTREMLKLQCGKYYTGKMVHLYTDNAYKHIGEQCGILHYVSDIYIEHLHVANGKAAMDKNYEISENINSYKRDKEYFDQWKRDIAPSIIQKIKNQIN